jgi:flagellar hook-length control protein FliK
MSPALPLGIPVVAAAPGSALGSGSGSAPGIAPGVLDGGDGTNALATPMIPGAGMASSDGGMPFAQVLDQATVPAMIGTVAASRDMSWSPDVSSDVPVDSPLAETAAESAESAQSINAWWPVAMPLESVFDASAASTSSVPNELGEPVSTVFSPWPKSITSPDATPRDALLALALSASASASDIAPGMVDVPLASHGRSTFDVASFLRAAGLSTVAIPGYLPDRISPSAIAEGIPRAIPLSWNADVPVEQTPVDPAAAFASPASLTMARVSSSLPPVVASTVASETSLAEAQPTHLSMPPITSTTSVSTIVDAMVSASPSSLNGLNRPPTTSSTAPVAASASVAMSVLAEIDAPESANDPSVRPELAVALSTTVSAPVTEERIIVPLATETLRSSERQRLGLPAVRWASTAISTSKPYGDRDTAIDELISDVPELRPDVSASKRDLLHEMPQMAAVAEIAASSAPSPHGSLLAPSAQVAAVALSVLSPATTPSPSPVSTPVLAPAALPTAVDRIITHQVVHGLQRQRPDADRSLMIRLTPPELGTVRVLLREEDGQIHARILAEDPAVRQALQRELPHLLRDLRVADAPVASVAVERGQDAQSQDRAGQQHQHQQHRQPHEQGAEQRPGSHAPRFALDGSLAEERRDERPQPRASRPSTAHVLDALA